MKPSRFTEKQIIAILEQAEAGASISALCAKQGVSKVMFDQWRAQYSDPVLGKKTVVSKTWQEACINQADFDAV